MEAFRILFFLQGKRINQQTIHSLDKLHKFVPPSWTCKMQGWLFLPYLQKLFCLDSEEDLWIVNHGGWVTSTQESSDLSEASLADVMSLLESVAHFLLHGMQLLIWQMPFSWKLSVRTNRNIFLLVRKGSRKILQLYVNSPALWHTLIIGMIICSTKCHFCLLYW